MKNLVEQLSDLRGKIVNLPGNVEVLKQLDEIIEGLENHPETYALKPPPLTPPKRDE